MKKCLLWMCLLLCIGCLAACEKDDPTGTGSSQPGQNANGGSVVSVYDADVNLVGTFSFANASGNTLDMTQFAKPGYQLEGVFDMNRDIMLFNASGNQSPTVLLDTDFTAILKYSPVTYQITFDAVEGQLENAAEYTKMISYGEVVNLFPDASAEGMELDGWFDEDGNRFSHGTTPVFPQFTMEGYALDRQMLRLHAKYTVKYCDVRLMMQDGSQDIRIQVAYGQTLPDLSQYLKDDGNRAIMGFGVSPNAPVAFTDPVYTDLDLYALWREYRYIHFVYSDTETKVVKIFREGDMAVLPDGVWPGYVFEGWYASALLSGNKITKVAFNGMQDTYYAKWSVGSYTIQFVADGNLISSSTFSIHDTDILVPQVPQKPNYTGSWENYTLEFRDMVVNAVYVPEERKITLVNGPSYSYQTVSYGENYTLPVPTKQGHDFTGWYCKGQKITDAQGNALAPCMFDADVILTAGWEAKICTLYFESNGGNALDPVQVKYGEEFALTQVPVRQGFHFDGWYDDTMTEEYIGSVAITADTVIYAKWVKSTAISTVEDLKKISQDPAGNYYLTADIDLKGGDWLPVECFTGILDGNGHKIYNFSLRQDGTDLGFVIRQEGTIKNVIFSNVDVSATISGAADCAIGVASAYNLGKLTNVTVEKVSMLVNVSGSNVNHVVRMGCLAGENAGTVAVCVVQGEIMCKYDVRCQGYGDSHSAQLFVGGAVGKDSGTVARVNADVLVDANAYVYTDCYIGDCYESAYLQIGGITGGEYGIVKDCTAVFTCQLASNAGGDSESRRYTRIGGVAGCTYETSTVTGCYSTGSISFQRVGRLAGSYEMAVGGIVGKVESGTVNDCASGLNITLQEGYGGTTGGIVGWVNVSGKVSNVAYYGTIRTENLAGGYFGGLAGQVNGWLTKGYFKGQILSDSTNMADIAGRIDTSGSVSKTIGNGNTGVVCAAGSGSSIYNYLIGQDYDAQALLDRELLFDVLGLFEADYWSIDEETGLYLIRFPERP